MDPVAELARKVAHELNSPLDGVMRFIALAQRKVRDKHYEDIERYLADAEFGLQRMAEILRELTELPAVRAGAGERAARLPVDQLLGQAAKSLGALAEERGVRVEVRCAITPVPMVDGHLYQVVSNLLKNAIEAMPRGGRAEVSAERVGHVLRLRVVDEGEGLPADARLFEPFFTTKPPGQGMGLGLAMCKEIVAKLGGRIELANRVMARGCEATVELPLEAIRH